MFRSISSIFTILLLVILVIILSASTYLFFSNESNIFLDQLSKTAQIFQVDFLIQEEGYDEYSKFYYFRILNTGGISINVSNLILIIDRKLIKNFYCDKDIILPGELSLCWIFVPSVKYDIEKSVISLNYFGRKQNILSTYKLKILDEKKLQNWLIFWFYRVPITITERSGQDLTDYQVNITFDSASLISQGKMRLDCGDIRFTDSDGVTLLPYWIDLGCNTNSTRIWVRVNLTANQNKTIYMYYGNSTALRDDKKYAMDLWSLREHDSHPSYDPSIYFFKSLPSIIRVDSNISGAASFGQGLIFTIFPKSFLHNKKIKIRWNAYFTFWGSRKVADVLVCDVELHRNQTLPQSGGVDDIFLCINLLNYTTISGITGWNDWRENISDIVDLSTFKNDFVTLIIRLIDYWIQQTVILDIDYLQILDIDDKILLNYDFNDTIIMEVTNTLNDYGLYRKYISPEPYVILMLEETILV